MKEIFKNAKEVIRSRKSKRKYNRLAKRAQEHTMKYIELRTQIKNWATRTQEELEDTNGVIRIVYRRRTDNTMAKRKNYKRTNNDLQNIHIKLKIDYVDVTDLIDVIIYYIII